MTRLSYIERDDADPDLHAIFDAVEGYGSFANQVRTMAHCPPVLKHIMALLFDLRAKASLRTRHIELLNVTVAMVNACNYCIAHHAPGLKVEGISDEGVERLLEDDDHPELDAVDRLVVSYARQISGEPRRITDDFFGRLRAHLTEAQIAELTWRIGLAGAFNRINQALDIDIESDLVQTGSASGMTTTSDSLMSKK